MTETQTHGFSPEEREACVLKLTELYEHLLKISVDVQKVYGKTSRIGHEADLATKVLFNFKNEVANLD
jgi:hypothetical protein